MTLWLAARDPRVPWAAKAFCAAAAAYALSPVDLIPDFIPVLGLLDELVLLPAALWVALRMLPPAIAAELRAEAERRIEKPVSRTAGLLIVVFWIAAALIAAGALASRSGLGA